MTNRDFKEKYPDLYPFLHYLKGTFIKCPNRPTVGPGPIDPEQARVHVLETCKRCKDEYEFLRERAERFRKPAS